MCLMTSQALKEKLCEATGRNQLMDLASESLCIAEYQEFRAV